MKQHLLPQGTYYKANLHCHSDRSDGQFSPEELKKAYREKGYSILAYTDHDLLLDRRALSDESFLALNGIELEFVSYDYHTCHVCAIAPTADSFAMPCRDSQWDFWLGNAAQWKDQNTFLPNAPDLRRENTPESVTAWMTRLREAGFFVTYNHPTWSQESYEQYMNYHGMHAMEMVNYGCVKLGYEEYNPRVYNDLLRRGEPIYCVMTDDNHGTDHMFGGWTMIAAPSLAYTDVIDALFAGNFYCSEGPEIREFSEEDGVYHLTCSPAAAIFAVTDHLHGKRFANEDGSPITEATFAATPNDKFVRFVVIDQNGKHACTNAHVRK